MAKNKNESTQVKLRNAYIKLCQVSEQQLKLITGTTFPSQVIDSWLRPAKMREDKQ